MIRSLYFEPGRDIRKNLPPQEFAKLIRNRRGFLWVDFVAEPPDICLPILEGFGFHHLAIDDALQETHVPKLDDWGDYLYVVLNYMHVNRDSDDWDVSVDELDTFLGMNYIVTHHDHPIEAVDATWNACDRDPRTLQDGPDHILYKIADFLVADYMPLIEEIDEGINRIEDQVFHRDAERILERLFALKRVLLAMRRILLPQREVLNKLARDRLQGHRPQGPRLLPRHLRSPGPAARSE